MLLIRLHASFVLATEELTCDAWMAEVCDSFSTARELHVSSAAWLSTGLHEHRVILRA